MINTNKFLPYLHLGWRGIAETASDLLSFFYIRTYLAIILFFNLSNWAVAKIINSKAGQEPFISQYKGSGSIQDLFILHYNVDFGVNLIGDVKRVYIIPLFGLIIIIVNLFLLSYFYKNDKFISHLLLAVSVLVNIFLSIALASIYLINFRYL